MFSPNPYRPKTCPPAYADLAHGLRLITSTSYLWRMRKAVATFIRLPVTAWRSIRVADQEVDEMVAYLSAHPNTEKAIDDYFQATPETRHTIRHIVRMRNKNALSSAAIQAMERGS